MIQIYLSRKLEKIVIYLVVYVDGLLMTRNNENYIASIKKELNKGFEMTDLGHLHYYLSIEVTQHPKYIFLSQGSTLENFLIGLAWINEILYLLSWNRI